ncbi:hypothetical protein [Psychrobacillus sp. NPDC093200]|uniref:hypothetical protein n=1 Tax=Psychrobacillus sp. NPDC093200 TaxID=3390656 RepID=UPI003D035122
MKKRNIALFIALAVVMNVICVYLFFYIWEMIDQGEYRKYDNGVTIEVNNFSDQNLSDLIFSYSVNQLDFKEVGMIKSLKAGESTQITGSSKEIKSSDTSLYLHYYIDNGGKAVNSLAYFYTVEPKKAVIVLDIHEVKPHGFLKFEYRGYNGWTQYGPDEINY